MKVTLHRLGLAVSACLNASVTAAAPTVASRLTDPLSRDQFNKDIDQDFRAMDANHDSFLARAEIEVHQRQIIRVAALARNNRLFKSLDADNNSQISPNEFAQLVANLPPPDISPVMNFDTNHDGKVSLVENRIGTQANFDRLDGDRNGIVTATEMRAAGLGR